MAFSASTPPSYADLERAYQAAVSGSKPPTAAVLSGALLNAQLGVVDYEPDTAYLVTETGIVPLAEE